MKSLECKSKIPRGGIRGTLAFMYIFLLVQLFVCILWLLLPVGQEVKEASALSQQEGPSLPMSHPLGLRAKLKGPQAQKRTFMKHQVSTYCVQVRLPAALQLLLRDAAASGQDSVPGRGATPVQRERGPSSNVGQSALSLHLPLFSEAELMEDTYSTAFRGVVTVTIPSASSCRDAIGYILAAAEATERPPEDYQLVQCFADFSPDHTRRRLTGDSDAMPIKTVMQFPFHLALVLSPYVVLRERLVQEDEPRQRGVVMDQYRKQFLVYAQGYQLLLQRLIEQSNFLRGREEEARRGKKLEERQQYYELARFRTLKEEKDARRAVEWHDEYFRRACLEVAERALREKLALCNPDTSTWLAEHAHDVTQLVAVHRHFLSEQRLLHLLRERLTLHDAWRAEASDALIRAKQRLYTTGRLGRCAEDAAAIDDVTVITPGVVESKRRALAPLALPQYYGPTPMIANECAILDDVHSSSRSLVLR